jgi:two-component system sensor histidine kinase/response regulator
VSDANDVPSGASRVLRFPSGRFVCGNSKAGFVRRAESCRTGYDGRVRFLWLMGGAVAMGLGIWSMHYIGMLAYSLPVAVRYDWPTVLVSLLAAMLASGVALFIVSRNVLRPLRTLVGGSLMGIGIAAMHYIGMEAMRLPAMCRYSSGFVTLSVILAIVISLVALWLTFHLREETAAIGWRKPASAS